MLGINSLLGGGGSISGIHSRKKSDHQLQPVKRDSYGPLIDQDELDTQRQVCSKNLKTCFSYSHEDQWTFQLQIKRKLMQLYFTCHLTYQSINWSVKVRKCAIEYTWWEQQRSGNKRLAPSGTMISSKMSLSDNSNVSEDEEDEEVCAQSHEFIQNWNKAKTSAKQHPYNFVIAKLFF